jgi:hypothetical protein
MSEVNCFAFLVNGWPFLGNAVQANLHLFVGLHHLDGVAIIESGLQSISPSTGDSMKYRIRMSVLVLIGILIFHPLSACHPSFCL